jgi:hypothetical protein
VQIALHRRGRRRMERDQLAREMAALTRPQVVGPLSEWILSG